VINLDRIIDVRDGRNGNGRNKLYASHNEYLSNQLHDSIQYIRNMGRIMRYFNTVDRYVLSDYCYYDYLYKFPDGFNIDDNIQIFQDMNCNIDLPDDFLGVIDIEYYKRNDIYYMDVRIYPSVGAYSSLYTGNVGDIAVIQKIKSVTINFIDKWTCK
jgi:hypothetical protein